MAAYEIGDEVLSGWRIVRPIGEGAFGRVFEVQKVGIGFTARSALKVVSVPKSGSMVDAMLAEGMDRGSVAGYFRGVVDDFAAEVALASSLNHPGVVAYQDHEIVEHADGVGWDVLLRMELLEPLTVRMAAGQLAEAEVARLGSELADALAYCHSRDVIHRDVKPSNVFADPSGRFKLGDFGVARTGGLTSGALSVKGTEDYMAPEMFRGEGHGPSVDVYSLGVMLYQLLNGNRLPFLPPVPAAVGYRDRELAKSRRLAGEPLPPLHGCDPALAAAVLSACAPNPEDRPTAAGLCDVLGGIELPEACESLVDGPAGPEAAATAAAAPKGPGAECPTTVGVWEAFGDVAKQAAEEARKREEEARKREEERRRQEKEQREQEKRERLERERRAEQERRAKDEEARKRAEQERLERECRASEVKANTQEQKHEPLPLDVKDMFDEVPEWPLAIAALVPTALTIYSDYLRGALLQDGFFNILVYVLNWVLFGCAFGAVWIVLKWFVKPEDYDAPRLDAAIGLIAGIAIALLAYFSGFGMPSANDRAPNFFEAEGLALVIFCFSSFVAAIIVAAIHAKFAKK